MTIALVAVGAAGALLRSFAYPLAFLLAALFGVAAAATHFARSSGRGRSLFWIATALAGVAMYLYLVSGGGGPPTPTPSR